MRIATRMCLPAATSSAQIPFTWDWEAGAIRSPVRPFVHSLTQPTVSAARLVPLCLGDTSFTELYRFFTGLPISPPLRCSALLCLPEWLPARGPEWMETLTATTLIKPLLKVERPH